MGNTSGIGSGILTVTAVVALAMSLLSFFLFPVQPAEVAYGAIFPSPGEWEMPSVVSLVLEIVAVSLVTLGMTLLNHRFTFIKTTHLVLPVMFLVFTASNPWLNSRFGTSILLCGVVLMSLSILFNCFRSRNATQEMFVIATFISIGSMCQFAFLPFAAPVLLGAFMLKCLRIKEFLTFLMGLVAPYWVAFGLGVSSPADFHLPLTGNPFNTAMPSAETMLRWLGFGLVLFPGIMLGINNTFRLYAGNARISAMNGTITLVGLTAGICALADSQNMTAYLATLNFAVAVQWANICALWKVRKEWLVAFIPGLLFAALFIFILLE